MEQLPFLRDLVVVFGIGTLIVFLFQKLRQSPVVGFLMTGLLVGPYSLSLIQETETVEVLAEVGVMLLLFSLGLEFSLKKLLQIRTIVLGGGSLQVGVTILTVVALSILLGFSPRTGLVFGFIISLSSTAIVLKMLMERGEIDSIHGRVDLGILIFQDLCIAAMIVVVPILAGEGSIWLPLLQALGMAVVVVTVVVLAARYVFPAILDQMANTRSKELFISTSILMFLGTAWITSLAGFSLALGSFLAGLILSESEYSHQIFADVRPLRDTLNSLFFISIGMLVDPRFLADQLGSVLAVVASIVIGKAFLTAGSILAVGLPLQVAILAGLATAQIGEFSFVILKVASEAGLVTEAGYQVILSGAVTTMILTPSLFLLGSKIVSTEKIPRWSVFRKGPYAITEAESGGRSLRDHVIICGFGVSGRNVAQILKQNEIPYLVLELNSQTVAEQRKQGEPIYFGDCTDPEILAHGGIQHARVLVLSISDPLSTRRAVRSARSVNPEIVILVRTKYVAEIDELYDLGATEVVPEEFEASLELITRILRVYHLPRELISSQIKTIRNERYGVFRDPRATVPRLRLSHQLDVYAETIEIKEGSPAAGKTVAQLDLRRSAGVLILGIIREGETINNPGPSDLIRPGDMLVLSGTKEQLNQAFELLQGSEKGARARIAGAPPKG